VMRLQGYLAHKKTHAPRALQESYGSLGGLRFLVGEVPRITKQGPPNRGASLIRPSPPPVGHHRALGMGLP